MPYVSAFQINFCTAEYGDQEDQDSLDKYLVNGPLVHNQSPKVEAKIMEVHKTLRFLYISYQQ